MTYPECIIKKYSFCSDIECSSTIEASEEVEYTLMDTDNDPYDVGYNGVIKQVAIPNEEYLANKLRVGDVMQI